MLVSLIQRRRDAGDEFQTPLFCLGEFWRIATEPRGAGKSPSEALNFLRAYLGWAPATPIGPDFALGLLEELDALSPRGAAVFDVAIGLAAARAECDELWTFDKRFPDIGTLLVVRNPLLLLL